MDGVRGQRQRRIGLDQAGVEPVAAAHVDEAGAVAGVGQIIVLKERAQPAVGREDRIADDGGISGAQADPLGLGHRVRKGLHRPVIRRGFGRIGKLGVELRDHVADGELGIDHARRQPLAEAPDRAIHQCREFAVAGQVVLIILDIAERRRAAAGGEGRIKGVEAAEMVDRADRGQRQHVGLKVGEVVLALIFEHVIGKRVGRVQPGAVDRPQRREIGIGRSALAGIIFVADIVAEMGRVAEIAAEHARDRVAAQIVLIALVEQAVEPAVRAVVRGGGRGRRRRGGSRRRSILGERRGGGEQRECEQEGLGGHDVRSRSWSFSCVAAL